jgi:STE24 endopeptidase
MYFVVILAFALVLSNDLPPESLVLWKSFASGPLVALILGQLLLCFGAALLCRSYCLARHEPTLIGHERTAARLARCQQVMAILIVALLLSSMLLTRWPALVRLNWGLARYPLLYELVVLAPFITNLTIFWAAIYPVELALRDTWPAATTDSQRQQLDPTHSNQPDQHADTDKRSLFIYLMDRFRHQVLIVAAPMIVIVFAKHYTDTYRVPLMRWTTLPWAADALLGLASLCVLIVSPVILSLIWSTQRLPPGPLRERFVRTCERIGLKYREILLWHTHGMAVNAAVMGFVPPLRYILVSDALIETLEDDEVEAVFGHEAGHVHHWHLQFFGLFALVSMYLAGGLFIVVQTWVRDPALLEIVALGALMLIWLFGFGWLSRKFERQADLYGVRCVTPDIQSCTDRCPVHGDAKRAGLCTSAASLFGRTLNKIADLNGIAVHAPSWRHGSIESRCRLIETLTADESALRRFDKRLLRIKIALVVAAAIGTAMTVWLYAPEVMKALNSLLARR